MIIFFGSTGSGKSMQGKLMAVRHDWRWISAGELLRNANDPKIDEMLKIGKLLPDEITSKLTLDAIDGDDKVILDGYPRNMVQAETLIENVDTKSSIAIVLDLDSAEIEKRLALRKRMEDDPATIANRIELYNTTTQPILDYLAEHNIIVEHVDGAGLVGVIHDRIETVLEKHNIVGPF